MLEQQNKFKYEFEIYKRSSNFRKKTNLTSLVSSLPTGPLTYSTPHLSPAPPSDPLQGMSLGTMSSPARSNTGCVKLCSDAWSTSCLDQSYSRTVKQKLASLHNLTHIQSLKILSFSFEQYTFRWKCIYVGDNRKLAGKWVNGSRCGWTCSMKSSFCSFVKFIRA